MVVLCFLREKNREWSGLSRVSQPRAGIYIHSPPDDDDIAWAFRGMLSAGSDTNIFHRLQQSVPDQLHPDHFTENISKSCLQALAGSQLGIASFLSLTKGFVALRSCAAFYGLPFLR